MKQGRNVEVGGKAITNITPAVRGIRNISIPLIMTPSVASSPASPLTIKKLPTRLCHYSDHAQRSNEHAKPYGIVTRF